MTTTMTWITWCIGMDKGSELTERTIEKLIGSLSKKEATHLIKVYKGK